MLEIRFEKSGDAAAIRSVNKRAFGQPDEAELVDALRGGDAPLVSLVAESEGEIVGQMSGELSDALRSNSSKVISSASLRFRDCPITR